MTILLTGATGFLGSHLLEALLNSGYAVVILKRSFSDTWRIVHLLDRVKTYDVDKVSVDKAITESHIDVVVHMATLYRKFDTGKEISEMVASNIAFPCEILESGIRHGLKAFINTGTFFEYDCSALPVKEDAPTKPFNFYAKTKLAFENILKTYSPSLSTVTLRLFSPYGPKDNDKLIPMLIRKAAAGEPINLSDGLQKLDFVFAEDITDAFLRAIKLTQNPTPGHSVFNIGSGMAISVREIVSILEQQLGASLNKQWGPPSSVDIPIAFADIERAKEILGWVPRHSIHEGLAKTIKYYREKSPR